MATLDQWIDALESGKYTQGQNLLKTKDGKFCCLGVLCHISGVDMTIPEGVDADLAEFSDNDGSFVENCALDGFWFITLTSQQQSAAKLLEFHAELLAQEIAENNDKLLDDYKTNINILKKVRDMLEMDYGELSALVKHYRDDGKTPYAAILENHLS